MDIYARPRFGYRHLNRVSLIRVPLPFETQFLSWGLSALSRLLIASPIEQLSLAS